MSAIRSRAQAAAPPYKMSVDLSVLESLGINLYSNAAAVLSELVANAYDADATLVSIRWKTARSERIVVRDDGIGMSARELNERFLRVGYKKREAEGAHSKRFRRPYMGRKGIGKLSVFSIARTVTVYSTTGRGSNGLVIRSDDLTAAIRAGVDYHPDAVTVPRSHRERGTVIILDDLKSQRADLTAMALRKRLARRFDVLDQTPRSRGGFYIDVNNKRITYADRQELKRLEFIWEFGQKELPDSALPSDVTRFVLARDAVNEPAGWKVRGWIGTARKPTDLTADRDAGSLKNIIVLARKRPIQEGIIEKLDFSRIFGNYVTGQIEADFLDLDDPDYDDIATSDRQRLIEDDERVVALQRFLREAFVKAADQWSEHRPKKEAADALRRYPKLREWVDSREPWQQPAAEKMIGTIASLEMEAQREREDRATLLRSGILAFERVGLRKTTADLDKLSTVTADQLLPLLGQQDAYEAGLWIDILRSRVEAIDQFRNLTSTNQREKVLQKHLFDNLWLLDASWERAAIGGRMEENLRDVEPGLFARDRRRREIRGRIDIRYAHSSGRHVIVELKRYSVREEVEVLAGQGLKYHDALVSLLRQQRRSTNDVEVIFVLGYPPRTSKAGRLSAEEHIRNQFANINGHYLLYDQLIESAKHQYDDYLQASDKARRLDELLSAL